MPTLHVHLDESGDFTFSTKGSKYYNFAAAWTYEPEALANEITRLRFSILKNGTNLESFHASVDKQWCRDKFVATIASNQTWKYAALLVEKVKVNPSIRSEECFYPKFLNSLLCFIFRGSLVREASSVMVFTDTLPVKKRREAVEKAIRTACQNELAGKSFQLFHHKEECNTWIQVADYCSWAIHRKWEHGDARTYDQIKARLHAPELDAMRYGGSRYY